MSQRPVAIAIDSESDLDHEARDRGPHRAQHPFGTPHPLRPPHPDAMLAFGREAADNGFKVIIAGAGGAAHWTASTPPLSKVQMPNGVPVDTVAIDGARNAGYCPPAFSPRPIRHSASASRPRCGKRPPRSALSDERLRGRGRETT
jgi:phosphoribosylcarboxyaminoimidazole (NCAIR) mutase